VQQVLDEVKVGNDLTEEEHAIVARFIAKWADVFALSLSKVKTVPGAVHTLDIPPDAKFRTKVGQRPLSPPQKAYFHGKLDEMLAAGIIEQVHPSRVKCLSPTKRPTKAAGYHSPNYNTKSTTCALTPGWNRGMTYWKAYNSHRNPLRLRHQSGVSAKTSRR
jgi:hypothetical protein